MVLKVLFVLAALALVNLPPCSATDEQQCVSKAEFDSQMAAQTAAVENVVTQITALENGYRNWRNATLFILQWVVSRNPDLRRVPIPDQVKTVQDTLGNVQDTLGNVQDKLGNVQDKLENMQDKMEQQQNKTNRLLDELATLRNTTMDALTDLQHQIKQQQNSTDREIAALENTIMDGQANLQDNLHDKVVNLHDKLDTFQNTTEASTRKNHHEVVELLQNNTNSSLDGQVNLQDKVDTLQDKVIKLQDKLDTFQNTTEASTRKNHHEVVELLQNNTNSSLDGTEELHKQLENITEGLQDQLPSCNGTDISIQYLPTSCREIAELNPHSPPGYYKISTTSGAVQVYCKMTTPDNPASSCQDIATQHPLASSGYYWVNSSNGTAVQVYCDMERRCCGSTGGWMRAAYLDMTDPTHHCPTGFRLTSHSKRSCERITSPGCTPLTFTVPTIKYNKVCGKVIAYQHASVNGFWSYLSNRALTLDGNYVDGVSITHGHPRRHIWTFAGAADEQLADGSRCPCTKTDTTYTGVVPPFVGNDYFCDTGSRNHYQFKFYPDNPLWDGSGCGSTSSCCSFNSPPWFCKDLPQPTTDDIEVRVCTDYIASNEDVTIEGIELYVQ